jgi:hypothetical protein
VVCVQITQGKHPGPFGKKQNFNYPERAVVLRPGPVLEQRAGADAPICALSGWSGRYSV